MPAYHYYLTEDKHVIRVWAKRRPGPNTIPERTTWIVQELLPDDKGNNNWHGTWEITWGRLKQLTYIGRVTDC